MNLEFSSHIFEKNSNVTYFMKTHLVETEFFFLRKEERRDSSADSQMERHDKAYNRFSQFSDRA